MKNYIKNLCGFCFLCVLCVSCAKDDDSNPVLNTQDLQMTLLNSEYPNGLVLDLSKSETVNLKIKEQPNYGYPAITVYSVQVSINPAFQSVAPSVATPSVRYRTLSTSYTKANMKVDAMELNNAIIKMYQAENDGNDPTGLVMDAYVRVRAQVSAQGGRSIPGTECYSNVIKLSNVTVAYVAAIPKELYISGTSIRGGKEAKDWGPVYGSPGCFYTLAYFGDGDSFLWGDDEDTGTGFSLTTSVDDQAEAGPKKNEKDEISVTNPGWYVLYMETSVDKENNLLLSDLTFYPGAAYIIGATTGNWDNEDPNSKMTAPDTADGEWISPVFTGSGELRAYIKVPGLDWWRTEFTLLKGHIFWRTTNIISSWADNAGADYSVSCSAGQRFYVNFDKLTGEVK